MFANQKEWLQHTISFFRQRGDLRLLIRAHPDESFPKVRIRLGEFASELAERLPNVFVLGHNDKISTYSLIEHCTAGLVWVSNIGIDIILRNKPVIAAGNACYGCLEIMPKLASTQDYFRLLDEWAKTTQPPTPSQVLAAKKYQRLVFKDISLCATSPNYISTEYRLGGTPMHPEQQIFYEILQGSRDRFGRK